MISRDDITLYILGSKTGTEKLEIGNVEMGNTKPGKKGLVRDSLRSTAPRLNRLREVRHTVVASLSLVLAFLAEVTGRGYQREGSLGF